MNIVWPVTALYGSVFAVWVFRFGRKRAMGTQAKMSEGQHWAMMKDAKGHPTASQIAIATSHCGAGCALGDIAAEFTVFGLRLQV